MLGTYEAGDDQGGIVLRESRAKQESHKYEVGSEVPASYSCQLHHGVEGGIRYQGIHKRTQAFDPWTR